MRVAVIGAGYVGLVTAACLARLGHTVHCIDNDQQRVRELQAGIMPIHEPDLEEMVRAEMAGGRLSFHSQLAASHGTDLAIVAVGTLDDGGEWTNDTVREAIRQLAHDRDAPRVMVVRSTLLPGTAVALAEWVRSIDPDVEIGVNPEFTREGSAVADFLSPDRIVIGTTRDRGGSVALPLLRSMYQGLDAAIVETDATSAEVIKVGSNVFLGLKIGYANELARLCAATGADVMQVVDGIGLDRRIGRAFMTPGPGFGGSCLPSQARALPRVAAGKDVRAPIMDAIDASNREQTEWVAEMVASSLGSALRGSRVALLGLAFKAGTDDLRESPAMRIAMSLAGRGAGVVVHDPAVGESGARELASAGFPVGSADDAPSACRDAQA
nr:UDP-glucose/GDP-mannose dehydrogenase family protein [Chloroflexota bacterium]